MKESKEKIRARMLKNASKLWGFSDTESEAAFDPVVGLIIGSLATELEKISYGIHEAESRVVEKLVELLTPEPITGAMPSHSVIRANPVQPLFDIYPKYQFFLYKRLKNLIDPSKSEEKTVFYTPAGNYRLFDGAVRYLCAGNKLMEFQDELYKEVIEEAPKSRNLPASSIWLGVEFDSYVDKIDGLSLFFDVKSDLHEEFFYQALGRATWYINDKEVSAVHGYSQDMDAIRRDLDDILKQDIDTTAKLVRHINRFYRKRFITFEKGNLSLDHFEWQNDYPALFDEVFNRKELGSLPINLFWFELRFPQAIPPEVLDDLYCSMNCFPVINRKLNEFTQAISDHLNIIPLDSEETFLDMRQVTNSDGQLYSHKSFSTLSDIKKGAYILRQGGVGRFDSRNAREIIHYLIELLRDESAAFSVLGTDMISSNLRDLDQTIARLEQRLQSSNIAKEEIPYLMLRSHVKDQLVFVEFWSTNASFSNKIKAGTSLGVYEGSDINDESVVFVLPTVGGRERMDTDERLNVYRKALLSKGRVVTREDIMVLCYDHFGKMLENVEVKKGIRKDDAVTSGFVRTMDIHIKLSKREMRLSQDELKFMIEDLQVKLEEQSANLMPFRVILP